MPNTSPPAPTVFTNGPLPDSFGSPAVPNDSAYEVTIISNGGSTTFRTYAYCFEGIHQPTYLQLPYFFIFL